MQELGGIILNLPALFIFMIMNSLAYFTETPEIIKFELLGENELYRVTMYPDDNTRLLQWGFIIIYIQL